MKLVRYSDKKRAWEIRRNRILHLKLGGMSMTDIARKEGITPQRVKQICDKGITS
jgi:DNA-binding CsgD family transcriptional regulator